MKKILSIILSILIIGSLAACSGTNSGNNADSAGSGTETAEPTEPPVVTVAMDTDVLALHFTVPEGFETVERYIEKFADDTLSQKSLNYKFADDSEIMVGYTFGRSITEVVSQERLDESETAEYGGKSFYIIEESKSLMAVNQNETNMYGIIYTFGDEIDREKFDAFMSGVSFTGNTTTEENDDDMYNIRYTLDSSWKLSSTNNTLVETPDGELVKKTLGWHFGEDEDNLNFRFIVRVFKNTTVEEQLSADYEYEEQELGGITYSVIKPTNDSKPYEYFTQQGDDVYEIRNNGVPGGWGVERSEESEAAFEKLLNSVSFK